MESDIWSCIVMFGFLSKLTFPKDSDLFLVLSDFEEALLLRYLKVQPGDIMT